MKTLDKPSLSHLYIHWPFCKNKCHYCDFVALEGHNAFQDRYHETLCKEINAYVHDQHYNADNRPLIETIYFGGGTPSLYPLDKLAALFTLLHNSFTISPTAEITLEVNPGNIDDTTLKAWQACGINRLSVGVQVLDDAVLAGLNRHQKASDVAQLMALAPRFITNLSIDLIMGLPGVSNDTWHRTLRQAVAWPINHISIYFLTVHEQTPLFFKVKAKKAHLLEDEEMVKLYFETITFLESHGFQQYEISNFARPGYESRHNQAYWNRKPYKGFGIGAASFDGLLRTRNEANLHHYLAWWHQALTPPPNQRSSASQELLTPEQEVMEIIMLGLRQRAGLDLASLALRLQPLHYDKLLEQIDYAEKEHLVVRAHGRVYLTRAGMALEHEVTERLVAALSR